MAPIFNGKDKNDERWKSDDNTSAVRASAEGGGGGNVWDPVKCLLEQGLLK